MSNYRNEAREQLARARVELGAGEDHRIKYAALELRKAMESLTYDRALAYKDEFPPQEYETWQPKKVMAVLLGIDPTADQDYSLSIGREPSLGEKPEVMRLLGTEKVLNMQTLKKHYDALGSFLHVQSMRQRRAGVKLDYTKMRERCEIVAAFLDEVLRSKVWNSTLSSFGTLECGKCGTPIRKRVPPGQGPVTAKCYDCGVTYTVSELANGQLGWQPDQTELKCANDTCGTTIYPFTSEISIGAGWTCEECSGRNVIGLGVSYVPPEADQPSSQDNQ